MFIGFSLPDILKQKYRVKVIGFKNGHLDLVQDNAGNLNVVEAFRMHADTALKTNSKVSKELDLDLKKIIFKNMQVSYFDEQSKYHYIARIEKIQSSLRDDSVGITADLKGNIAAHATTAAACSVRVNSDEMIGLSEKAMMNVTR